MSGVKTYRLLQYGKLLLLRAAVGGRERGVVVLRLLVDTGASYTMLPVEVVEGLGYDTHHPLNHCRIMSASGIIIAPVVEISWLNCLGQRVEIFPVVVHTLPSGTFIDGLLGMDFLSHCQAVVDIGKGEVRC